MTEASTLEFKSPMQKMQFEGLVEFIQEHNLLVGQVNAATGDKDALAESIAAKDEFAEIREQIAKLQEEFDNQVDVLVQEALNTDQGDTTEQTEKAKELKATISSGVTYYKRLYGDAAAEAFPKVERLKGVRTGGGGTGGKRIRGFNVVVTDADGANEYENFATAAKALGVDTKELQGYFFAKAGVEKLADVPDEVTFTLEWEDVAEDGTKTPASAEVRAYREVPTGTDGAVAGTEESTEDEEETDESVSFGGDEVNLENI